MTFTEYLSTPSGWGQLVLVAVGLLNLLSLWTWWSVRKAFVTTKACQDCRAACRAQVDARLVKQEASSGELHQAVAQAAPKDELAKVDKADETLKGEIKALAATIQGLQEQQRALARQVGLLMEHHIGRRT